MTNSDIKIFNDRRHFKLRTVENLNYQAKRNYFNKARLLLLNYKVFIDRIA